MAGVAVVRLGVAGIAVLRYGVAGAGVPNAGVSGAGLGGADVTGGRCRKCRSGRYCFVICRWGMHCCGRCVACVGVAGVTSAG